LNRVINESILGAALIRVLHSQEPEFEKFREPNKEALSIGLSILRLFATLIPVVSFVGNLALVTVLALGGHFVIFGSMTLGEFAAFNQYIALLIFPIIMIGFMSNVIARASASYQRIYDVLETEVPPDTGTIRKPLEGNIAMEHIHVSYDGKPILKDISLLVEADSRTAIIGPTAAGKTQLFYLLTGLIQPDSGMIKFDGQSFADLDKRYFYHQIGLVFQDSVIFNMSLRENIAFNNKVTDQKVEKAIATAELKSFIQNLPEGLDTIVSERGASLSGGQKQRVMLARALALDPNILLLDEFTARVDVQTERKILGNVQHNYPDITLLSITQTIEPIKDYDQIILLMEGEVIAKGTHEELIKSSPEYNQIYQSQRSTSDIELQSS
jgi:ATP-binding cassette subfamily B protein